MFTVLVTGDRNWDNKDLIQKVFQEIFAIHGREVTLIQGGAQGADLMAASVALEMGWQVVQVDADWAKYGRAAGPIRNKKMLEMKPDHVYGFHNFIHHSKGTRNCIEQAIKMEIPWSLHSEKN